MALLSFGTLSSEGVVALSFGMLEECRRKDLEGRVLIGQEEVLRMVQLVYGDEDQRRSKHHAEVIMRKLSEKCDQNGRVHVGLLWLVIYASLCDATDTRALLRPLPSCQPQAA